MHSFIPKENTVLLAMILKLSVLVTQLLFILHTYKGLRGCVKFSSNWIVCPLMMGNFPYWHHYEFCSRCESLLTPSSSCSFFIVSQILKMKPLIKSSAYHWTSNTLHNTTYKYLSQTVCFSIFGKYILFHQLIIAQFGFLHCYVVTFCLSSETAMLNARWM